MTGQLPLFGDPERQARVAAATATARQERADSWARFVAQQNRWAKDDAEREARYAAHRAAAAQQQVPGLAHPIAE